MTPWYAWALFIVGPFACAGAGAWVTFLWARRWADRALPAEWDKGLAAGYQLARRELAEAAHDDTTMLIDTGHFAVSTDHRHWCPGCEANGQLQHVEAEFVALRIRLGLVPDLWPGFDDHQAAPLLALPPSTAVLP